MIETGHPAFIANEMFGGPEGREVSPGWCFHRFGRTETLLPDGRLICIGGEHEDYYDSDFYIYNDVVVTDSSGRAEIFGYSEEAFPPTDFHTATLAGDRIIVIGNLSYPHLRKDKAQVLVVDTSDYSIRLIDPTGASPPWLHSHTAELVEDGTAIVVRGGLFDGPLWPSFIENIDDWRLDLDTWSWERLTRRNWPHFSFGRVDGKSHYLYWLRSALWHRDTGITYSPPDWIAEQFGNIGASPNLDLLKALYTPEVPHLVLPRTDEEFGTHRIQIDGVNVRYVENDRDIRLIVEGDLPCEIVEQLRVDLLKKLSVIQAAGIDCTTLVND